MKWVIRISNEHYPLTREESELILGKEIEWITSWVGMVETSEFKVEELGKLAAGVKLILKFDAKIELNATHYHDIQSLPFSLSTHPDKKSTFAVRFITSQQIGSKLKRSDVERYIGGEIAQSTGLKVNLTSPDSTYIVIQTGRFLVMGWLQLETDYKIIRLQSPKEYPFFGGGAMKPMLSRIMTNLLYPHEPIILDPFSGHGGFVREVSQLGYYGIGIEISSKIAREANLNHKFRNHADTEVIVGDALRLPFRRRGILQIVTDPPYAKQSTTLGRDKSELVNEWLEESTAEKIVISLPHTMEIDISSKWSLEYTYKDYVHRSLTRAIRMLVVRI
ncbi:MAG: THUMP domain-containing protein [Candidatus Kariarchaeaceae archaeon]|jgi:putative methyltransferase (TIGR01177 family)